MELNTRTFRVLVCLAVSMTSGSVLLAWLEPAPPPMDAAMASARLAGQARSAVLACSKQVALWRSVTLLPQAEPADGMALAAVAAADVVHFTIARNGAVHAGAAWLTQSRLADTGEIRIGLNGAMAQTNSAIPQAQCVALQALLGALNDVAIKQPERLLDRRGQTASVQSLLSDATSQS